MPTKIGDKIGGTNFALALSDLPVPAGTTDNSPAIHCRDRGPVRPRVPAGTTEGLPRRCFLSSLRDFAPPPDSTPAMNCRAIVCRPHGTMAQKIRGIMQSQSNFRPQRFEKATCGALFQPRNATVFSGARALSYALSCIDKTRRKKVCSILEFGR